MTADILSLSAVDLLAAYKSGALSPLDAARASLRQIEKLNPVLNAMMFVEDAAEIERQARESEARWRAGTPMGLLDGVPTTIKDGADVKGWPTREGSAVMPDAPCAAARLATLGVERAVIGSLGRDERNYLLRLWLVDVEKGEVIADVDRAILIASRRLMQDAAAAIPPLLRGEREARATLQVSANVADAQVTVDGEFRGATPLTLQLKPGKHELVLEKRLGPPPP